MQAAIWIQDKARTHTGICSVLMPQTIGTGDSGVSEMAYNQALTCHWCIRERGLNRAISAPFSLIHAGSVLLPAQLFFPFLSARLGGGRGTANGAHAGKCWVPAGTPSQAPRMWFGANFVRCGVLVTKVGAARVHGRGVPTHACTEYVCTFQARARPRIASSTPIVRDRHQNKQWCAGGGRGAGAVG